MESCVITGTDVALGIDKCVETPLSATPFAASGGGMAEREVGRGRRVIVLAAMKILMERWEDWRGILGPMYEILILRMMMRDDVPPPTSPTMHSQ